MRKSGFEAIEEDLISAPEWRPMSRSTSSFAKLMHLESQPIESGAHNEAVVVGGDGDFSTGKRCERSDVATVKTDVMDVNDSTVLTGGDSATTTYL